MILGRAEQISAEKKSKRTKQGLVCLLGRAQGRGSQVKRDGEQTILDSSFLTQPTLDPRVCIHPSIHQPLRAALVEP